MRGLRITVIIIGAGRWRTFRCRRRIRRTGTLGWLFCGKINKRLKFKYKIMEHRELTDRFIWEMHLIVKKVLSSRKLKMLHRMLKYNNQQLVRLNLQLLFHLIWVQWVPNNKWFKKISKQEVVHNSIHRWFSHPAWSRVVLLVNNTLREVVREIGKTHHQHSSSSI